MPFSGVFKPIFRVFGGFTPPPDVFNTFSGCFSGVLIPFGYFYSLFYLFIFFYPFSGHFFISFSGRFEYFNTIFGAFWVLFTPPQMFLTPFPVVFRVFYPFSGHF